MRATDNSASPDVLQHAFTDAIGSLRSALEVALLERVAIEERFTTDALTGDHRWETAYSLPGEGPDGIVRADLSLTWGAWSQAQYRRWLLTGELADVPLLDLDVVARAQELSVIPDAASVHAGLRTVGPAVRGQSLDRVGGPSIVISWNDDCTAAAHAIEVAWSGTLGLGVKLLEDGNRLDDQLADLGTSLSSTLVTLNDLV